MEEMYSQAIKAGVIGGVLFILLSIIDLIIAILPFPVIKLGLACIVFLLAIILAAGIGALAVKFGKPVLHDMKEALIVSGVAGLVAGFVYAVMNLISTFIRSIIAPNEVSDIVNSLGLPTSDYSYSQGWASSCCCAPFLMILVIILAIIGGAIYAALIAKIQ